jgi:hypothetical protein
MNPHNVVKVQIGSTLFVVICSFWVNKNGLKSLEVFFGSWIIVLSILFLVIIFVDKKTRNFLLNALQKA